MPNDEHSDSDRYADNLLSCLREYGASAEHGQIRSFSDGVMMFVEINVGRTRVAAEMTGAEMIDFCEKTAELARKCP